MAAGGAVTRHGPGPGAGAGLVEHILHARGTTGGQAGLVKHGHQAIAERLHHHAAVLGHTRAHLRDGLRDDGRGAGVAHLLEQRGAAAQIGKQDGALGDPRHD
jgi:hypothetical protein